MGQSLYFIIDIFLFTFILFYLDKHIGGYVLVDLLIIEA
jgi:hypothetical protein